jgi:anti-sigma factor (TIGR02949 family)
MTESSSTIDASCTHAEEHLQAYFDGMLAGDAVSVIERHLETCQPCACAYAFERRFRLWVKDCCGGSEAESRCRQEFRQKLERCRHEAREQG